MDKLSLVSDGPPPAGIEIPSAAIDATSDSSPQLVHQGARTAIYRCCDKGIKVFIGPNPPEDETLQLAHERDVSDFLPRSCHKRRVINVTEFQGRPALSFHWVEGVTVKEWLVTVRASAQVDSNASDLNLCLRVAIAITKTLSEFHAGGVACNALSQENIVLTSLQGDCVATVIDLSSAVICRQSAKLGAKAGVGAILERQLKDADLVSLGSILNGLFETDENAVLGDGGGRGTVPSDNILSTGDTGRDGRKRGKQRVLGEGLPLILGSLISALCDGTSSEQRYETAKDVLLDLMAMVDRPEIYLAKTVLDEWTLKGRVRLHERDKFYGRQVQMSMVLHLFQSSVVLGNQPLMAMISGPPGAGKSALVNQIKKPLMEKNGCFIEGKFDKSVRQDTVLASALDSFFANMINANMTSEDLRNAHASMKWRIHDAIGSESNNVLLEILPNLRAWMAEEGNFAVAEGPATPRSSAKEIGSSHRLKFMLCNLVGAIACRAHPLILFLDDLQWADETTLDIIQLIMTDPNIHHFLFLGCYRDNEVFSTHPFRKRLSAIQEIGMGISIVTIKVGPIEKESVNALLSDLLSLPPSLCRSLSMVVHNKTSGIILFILRFLSSLNDEGLLWFSMSSRRWRYDLKEISEKEIHEDVVSHMTQHMTRLSKSMQRGLRLAACLGPNFDAELLEMAQKGDEVEKSFLESCVEFGFLRSIGPKQYVWAHDQIKQAAYNLIPRTKQESFHLLVGSRLYLKTLPNKMEEVIFTIVDNMNLGSSLIQDQDKKYDLSELNLKAGEKALASSAYHTAVGFFLAGLSLLGPDTWAEKYKLTMELYDAASEALYLTGDFSSLSSLMEQPLANAWSFEEKLNIYNNVVRALAASLEMEKGIDTCLGILTQLGVDIPTVITADVYRDEFAQTATLLNGKSVEDLISLPIMCEPQKLAAMQFMNHTLSMTYVAKPLLHPIFVFHMVRMSIEYGICNVSCIAFGCYGGVLVSEPLWDAEGGHRMGRVATEMMKRLGAKEMIPRLYSVVYGFVNIWKEPRQTCLSKHLEAYELGIEIGDIEFGLISLNLYASAAIYTCGENLGALSQNLEIFTKRAYQFGQQIAWKNLVVFHQLTLDLMGTEGNALSPYSTDMTEDSLFESARNNNETSILIMICEKRKFVAFLTGYMETASKMYDLSNEFTVGTTGRMINSISKSLINGLIAFYFARKHREDEAMWYQVAQDCLLKMRQWSKNTEWNFKNKLHLLEAEDAFYKGDDKEAMACYNASIKAACDHRFVHEEGIAEEKAATFLLCRGRNGEAMSHFINAKRCYEVWGAQTLVKRIGMAIEGLLALCSEDSLAQ